MASRAVKSASLFFARARYERTRPGAHVKAAKVEVISNNLERQDDQQCKYHLGMNEDQISILELL